MGYIWYDLKSLKNGQVIEIEIGTAVNVKLMSYDYFTNYRNGLPYRFFGGFTTKSPCHVKVPFDGSWILVFDISYEGYFNVKSVRTITEQEDEEINKNNRENEVATRIEIEEKEAEANDPVSLIQMNKPKIFIVHGHDSHMKRAVSRFVEKIGYEPVILHEQANRGRTIIEKLEDYANDIQFAIILYSPADEMMDGKKRARQNVVFEHGLFVSRLTRQRVVAIYKKDNDIESLSDLSGVLYIKYEGDWKSEVEREIKAAGLIEN